MSPVECPQPRQCFSRTAFFDLAGKALTKKAARGAAETTRRADIGSPTEIGPLLLPSVVCLNSGTPPPSRPNFCYIRASVTPRLLDTMNLPRNTTSTKARAVPMPSNSVLAPPRADLHFEVTDQLLKLKFFPPGDEVISTPYWTLPTFMSPKYPFDLIHCRILLMSTVPLLVFEVRSSEMTL